MMRCNERRGIASIPGKQRGLNPRYGECLRNVCKMGKCILNSVDGRGFLKCVIYIRRHNKAAAKKANLDSYVINPG